MERETIEYYIKRYGDPLLRFKTGASYDEYSLGDIPQECAVFEIKHVTKVMVVSCYGGNRWCCNTGERVVIDELLKRVYSNFERIEELENELEETNLRLI